MYFECERLKKDLIRIFNVLTLNDVKEIDENNTKLFLKVIYEYSKHRHISETEKFSDEEMILLSENVPTLLQYLDNGLWTLILNLDEKDIFDYCRYRSAVQFLIDDFKQFIPENEEKQTNLNSLVSNFEQKEYFLSYNYDDDFPDPYPKGPVPKHDGVPESHWWWRKVEEIYE